VYVRERRREEALPLRLAGEGDDVRRAQVRPVAERNAGQARQDGVIVTTRSASNVPRRRRVSCTRQCRLRC
jgi:hypothetical protein